MPAVMSPSRGFTLIELLVTLAVVAILVTVAVPNFQIFLINSRMASQANDLITSFGLARSEAVKRGANVTICASNDGSTCVNSGNDWAPGWVVRDAAGVIQVQQALSGASTLAGGADVAHTVVYTPNGRTNMSTAATVATSTLTLCPPSPAAANGRAIQIDRNGRARVAVITTCP